ncbi:MAG: DinB family protein [Deltaproteobacteria bacterium]|jgi:hypothetical protein
MSHPARELAEKLEAFRSDIVTFVENCSEDDWGKTCAAEGWPVGVVARHLGASHLGVLDLARMIVAGEPLPDLTSEIVDQMNARHAEKHAGCTRDEVLGILEAKVPEFVRYVAGLSDEDLNRAGYLTLLGSDVSIERLIELVVLNSGKIHLESMKGALES